MSCVPDRSRRPVKNPIRRLAISTGGGDAPGLNAVIRAVTLSALGRGWEVWGIRDSFNGLLEPARYSDGGVCPLDRAAVRGITHLGGTILGTTNRGDPFAWPVEDDEGGVREVDRSDELVGAFREHGLDAAVVVGGDGTMRIAHRLSQKGLRVVGVPKTIDNDLEGTVVTFGFDTAVTFATHCLDRLHSTAEAHDRVFVVEVMGRYAGWIALHAGLAGTADAILIPEIPYDLTPVVEKIREREAQGREFSMIVVAEGAHPVGGEPEVEAREAGREERLGGIGARVAEELEERTGKEARSVRLGHLLRGGSPTTRDRILALRFGAAAVEALAGGHAGDMVALDPPTVRYVPLADASRRMKRVPLDCDTIRAARDVGIRFGDEGG